MNSKPRIGFIGLGSMGFWMAANLRKNGHPLTVHDLDAARAEPLVDQGAAWAASPADLPGRSDVLITSLPGPPQVESVLLGTNGLLAHMRPGQTWIDMTTNDPELLKRIDAQASQRRVRTLEAPVTGAVDGAQEARLGIFTGGDPDLHNEMQPILGALGKSFHCGPIGAGNIAKLVTNLLWFINAVAIGEGLVLGAKAGIDLETLWAIIKSSAGSSWVAEHDVPSIFAGHYDPSFSLDLCAKDLRLTMAAGETLGVPLQLGGLVQQIFRQAQVKYGGDQGELHVVKLLEEATGVSLRVDGYE